METLRNIMVTISYISLIVFTEQLNEIAIVTNWLPIILLTCFKKTFSVIDLLMSLFGILGMILSQHASRAREKNSDQICVIRATAIVHLLMFSNIVLSYLLQLYFKMKRGFKKQVYRKLFLIRTFTIAIIACFMWLLCWEIDIVEKWINSHPFSTENNFLTIKGNLNTSVSFRGETSYHNKLPSIEKIFLLDVHRSSLVYVDYFSYRRTSSMLIKSYPGEDAKLTCSFEILFPASRKVNSLSVHFMKDKNEVRNTTRRTIHLPQKTLKVGSSYTFSATLFDIQPEDFGIYRAVLRIVLRYGFPISVSSTTIYQVVNVIEINSCVFNVSRIGDFYEFVDVPVGARLHFNEYYHRRFSESEYLRVEHFVNDIPLNMMSNISSECCLPSVHFYNEIWDKCPLRVPSIALEQVHLMGEYRFSEVKVLLCACSSIYGIHRFKFYSEVYDSKQKVWITSEFWHPQITVLYPKPLNMAWTYISQGIVTLIFKSKQEKSFSIFEGSALKILQNSINHDFILMQTIECLVILGLCFVFVLVPLFSLIYFFTLLSRFPSYAYDVMGLTVTLNSPDVGGSLANLVPIRDDRYVACQNYPNDVFILYVDDDKTFVTNELLPIFIDKKLSFFLSEDDLPPGRPKLEPLQLALSQSDKIIVIVSENFLIDEFYNSIVLPGIVLFWLSKGMIHPGHLMFLVCKPCRVPEYLIQNEQIVCMDYTKNLRNIFFRKFNEWLESHFIPPDFGKQPMLHPDFLQLTQI